MRTKKVEDLSVYVDESSDGYEVVLMSPITTDRTVICTTPSKRTANRIATLVGKYGL